MTVFFVLCNLKANSRSRTHVGRQILMGADKHIHSTFTPTTPATPTVVASSKPWRKTNHFTTPSPNRGGAAGRPSTTGTWSTAGRTPSSTSTSPLRWPLNFFRIGQLLFFCPWPLTAPFAGRSGAPGYVFGLSTSLPRCLAA